MSWFGSSSFFWFALAAALLLGAALSLVTASLNRKVQDVQEEAQRRYQQALARLKTDPENVILRQQALVHGRSYFNILRYNKGVSASDEVALMNDINAVSVTAQQAMPNVHVDQIESLEVRLGKLQDLRVKGLIDEDDYAKKKAEIMSQI